MDKKLKAALEKHCQKLQTTITFEEHGYYEIWHASEGFYFECSEEEKPKVFKTIENLKKHFISLAAERFINFDYLENYSSMEEAITILLADYKVE